MCTSTNGKTTIRITYYSSYLSPLHPIFISSVEFSTLAPTLAHESGFYFMLRLRSADPPIMLRININDNFPTTASGLENEPIWLASFGNTEQPDVPLFIFSLFSHWPISLLHNHAVLDLEKAHPRPSSSTLEQGFALLTTSNLFFSHNEWPKSITPETPLTCSPKYPLPGIFWAAQKFVSCPTKLSTFPWPLSLCPKVKAHLPHSPLIPPYPLSYLIFLFSINKFVFVKSKAKQLWVQLWAHRFPPGLWRNQGWDFRVDMDPP